MRIPLTNHVLVAAVIAISPVHRSIAFHSSSSPTTMKSCCRCDGSLFQPTSYNASRHRLSSTALLTASRSLNEKQSSNQNFRNRGRKNGPFFNTRDFNDLDELFKAVEKSIDSLHDHSMAAVWSRIPQLLAPLQSQRHTHSVTEEQEVMLLIRAVLVHTFVFMETMQPKELTTIILSMAKIVKIVRQAYQKRRTNIYQRAFGDFLLIDSTYARGIIFDRSAEAANRILKEFDARYLSNLAYSYALLDYNPQLENGSTLLGNIADASIACIHEFKPQEISILVWSYARLSEHHPKLFEKVGVVILEQDSLDSFKPQNLSNLVWAYATANIHHPGLFKKVGDAIVDLDSLDSFVPQDFSNIGWAYAAANVQHPRLFEKMGDAIVDLDSLDAFNSQSLANIVWAYARANVQHDALLVKIGETIVALGNLDSFDPRALANIAQVYARAKESRPEVFETIASDIAWSYGMLRCMNSLDV